MHMCLHKGSASSSGSACHGLGAHSSPRKASGSSRNAGGWGAGRTGQFPAMPLRPPAPLSQSWHRTSEASMPVRRRVFVSLPACHRSGKWAHWAPHTRASCRASGPAGPSPAGCCWAGWHTSTWSPRPHARLCRHLGSRVRSAIPSAFAASPCSSGPGGFRLVSQSSYGPT